MKSRAKGHPDANDVAVGLRIRAVRLSQRTTQEKLATLIGVTFQQVQKYEKGSNRVSAGRLHRIAQALHVPVATLIGPDDASQGSAAEGEEIISLLALAGAARLLRAFGQIESKSIRGMLVENAETLAREATKSVSESPADASS